MNKLILTALAMVWAGAALADPVEGMWKTSPNDKGGYAYVQIAPCGDKMCGTVVKAFDSAGAEQAGGDVGKAIITGMIAAGAGSFSDGQLTAPGGGKTYPASMSVDGDTLKVKVCPSLCKTLGWSKVAG
ncbi:MAG: DUF2147 domain-containing protein [Pseudomonadota bacterium]